MESDMLYIDISEHDDGFAKILKQLGNPMAEARSLLKSAAELAEAQPSARASLLYPYIMVCLLSEDQILKDSRCGEFLSLALGVLKDLSSSMPRSLVIAFVHAKFLVALGFLDSAEKECQRALLIDKPDDPWYHDIPLASTDGETYDERVYLKKKQIAAIIDAVFRMVKSEFQNLNEEQKVSFLSVRVANLLDQNGSVSEKTVSIIDAVNQYKSRQSWVLWRCPHEEHFCQLYEAPDPVALLRHVWDHVNPEEREIEVFYGAVHNRLKSCHQAPHAEHLGNLYLAVDDEGKECLCLRSIEALFNRIYSILPVLERDDQNDGISALEALDAFLNVVISFGEDENDDTLQVTWSQLLVSFAVDTRDALFDLTATIKWKEMREMVDQQISKLEIAKQDSVEMPLEEHNSELDVKDDRRNSGASHSEHHAFKYDYEALHRRFAVVNAQPPAVAKTENKGSYDPYAIEQVHTDYMKVVSSECSHQVVCSACFIERCITRRFTQILHHFSTIHVVGVKCPICSIRFVSASAVSFHMDFYLGAGSKRSAEQVQERGS